MTRESKATLRRQLTAVREERNKAQQINIVNVDRLQSALNSAEDKNKKIRDLQKELDVYKRAQPTVEITHNADGIFWELLVGDQRGNGYYVRNGRADDIPEALAKAAKAYGKIRTGQFKSEVQYTLTYKGGDGAFAS